MKNSIKVARSTNAMKVILYVKNAIIRYNIVQDAELGLLGDAMILNTFWKHSIFHQILDFFLETNFNEKSNLPCLCHNYHHLEMV